MTSISERDTPALVALAADLLQKKGWMLATAESCTGGLIAAACTAVAGSSDWFERGFVTYSNAAKADLLDVPTALLDRHGAVSGPVARAMAEGAVARARDARKRNSTRLQDLSTKLPELAK